MAIVAATSSVRRPTMAPTSAAVVAISNSGALRAIRYTPAVTIVAAWISAETGVGPSIASGNQVCSGNWPDLPHAPRISIRQIAVATPVVIALLAANTSLNAVLPTEA